MGAQLAKKDAHIAALADQLEQQSMAMQVGLDQRSFFQRMTAAADDSLCQSNVFNLTVARSTRVFLVCC